MPILIAALSALFTALGLFETAAPSAPAPAPATPPADDKAKTPPSPPAKPTTEAATTTTSTPTSSTPPATGQEPPAQKGTSLEDVEKLQRELNTARGDAGKYRNLATQSLVALAQAVGIELQTEKGKVDPETAVKQLQDQIDAMKAEGRGNAIDAAFERAAAKAGAKTTLTRRVLDGTNAFKDLDPKADDFQEKVNQIVQETVDEEPALKSEAPAAPRRNGGEFTGEPRKGLDEKIAKAESTRDFKESIRLKQEGSFGAH